MAQILLVLVKQVKQGFFVLVKQIKQDRYGWPEIVVLVVRQHTSAYVSISVDERMSGARKDRYGWPEVVVRVVRFKRGNIRALSEVT